MLTLVLGIGMITGGIGLGAKNIWDAATRKAFKDEKIMKNMVKNQKAQINELIEQNFEITNNIKKNMDVMIESTLDLLSDVSRIQQNIEKDMKMMNNKVCDFVLSTNLTVDSVDNSSGDIKEQDVECSADDKKESAEDLLVKAMVDAGEDEELAKICAEVIREEEELASAKRYKSAKKGGRK